MAILASWTLRAAGAAFADPGVDTFVLAVGGQARPAFPDPPPFSCGTFGVPPPVASFFAGQGVVMPAEGYAPCSIVGGFETRSAPAGPLADSAALDADFNNFDNDHFTGSSDARADYGQVGARALGYFFATPSVSGSIVEGAEAFGRFRDTFTVTSPGIAAGASGTARFTFSIDGAATVSGTDEARLDVEYQQNAGAVTTLLQAGLAATATQGFISAPTSFGTHVGPGTWGGFTLSTGSISGSGEFTTYDLPIVFGTPFDFQAGILAYAIPFRTDTAFIDFLATVRLTGIAVLNAAQQPVATFTVVSASGTHYDATGVHLNPDPFAVVSTSGTPVPGGSGYLTSMPQGSTAGAVRAAFLAFGTGGQQGVYASDLMTPMPPPIKVADLATAIPGGSGAFTGFLNLSMTASPVAGPDGPPIRVGFVGSGAAQQGIYVGDITDVANPIPPPIKVADLSTAIPGGAGTFAGFGGLSLITSPVAAPNPPPIRVGFVASGAGQQGVYLTSVADLSAPTPPPIKVADLATPIPSGAGSFGGFGALSLTTSPVASPSPPPIKVAFIGNGDGQQGVYAADVTDPTGAVPPSPIKVADLATAIPDGAGTFGGFADLSATISPIAGPQGPPIRVAFIGSGAAQQGVYVADVTDPTGVVPPSPIKVADLSSAIPGGAGVFTGFSALSASLDHVAFLGQGNGGQAGIYLASTLAKVVAVGDALEGKVVTALQLGREGLNGDRLSFAATFTDGSQGAFTFTVPPSGEAIGPGSVGASLRVAPSTTTPGDLRLSWGASCSPNAVNYAIYEGTIGDWYSHVVRDCADGAGLSEEITPSPGNRYYLVVSLGVAGEGSYGQDSRGMEIPPAAGGRCLAAQAATACP